MLLVSEFLCLQPGGNSSAWVNTPRGQARSIDVSLYFDKLEAWGRQQQCPPFNDGFAAEPEQDIFVHEKIFSIRTSAMGHQHVTRFVWTAKKFRVIAFCSGIFNLVQTTTLFGDIFMWLQEVCTPAWKPGR